LTRFFDFDIPCFVKNGRLNPPLSMKRNRQNKSLNISNSRWLAYTTAGAATFLCGPTSAEAEIHYSGILNVALPGDSSFSIATFPLNGSAHLAFWHSSGPVSEGAARFAIPGSHSRLGSSVGAFAGSLLQGGTLYLSKLASRVNLSQLTFNNSCYSTPYYQVRCHGGTIGRFDAPNGKFKHPGKGFIGFLFDTGGGPQYGWARIKTSGQPKYRLIVVDYAWADYGDRIRTGQKSSAGDMVDAVTESGSVGLLALGAAGLVAWRKRRGQATQ
jgi:hypothetical protein